MPHGNLSATSFRRARKVGRTVGKSNDGNTPAKKFRSGLRLAGANLRRYSLRFYAGALRLGHKPECDFKIGECKKILVVRNKGIGDDIMALPALRLLRQYLPDTQIDLLVKPWNSTLFEDSGLFDNILIFERNAKTRVHGIRPYDTKTLIRKIREENYDAAVCVMGQEIGLRLAFYGGIPAIVCNE